MLNEITSIPRAFPLRWKLCLAVRQGVSVCIVALDDDLLKSTHAELQKEFPSVELRAVPVNLGSDPEAYMSKVAAATENVPVSILINNAGFLLMGFFDQRPIEQHIANVECNALAGMRLTHYFYNRMVDQNIKGCITFTSSAAWFMVRKKDCQFPLRCRREACPMLSDADVLSCLMLLFLRSAVPLRCDVRSDEGDVVALCDVAGA